MSLMLCLPVILYGFAAWYAFSLTSVLSMLGLTLH